MKIHDSINVPTPTLEQVEKYLSEQDGWELYRDFTVSFRRYVNSSLQRYIVVQNESDPGEVVIEIADAEKRRDVFVYNDIMGTTIPCWQNTLDDLKYDSL